MSMSDPDKENPRDGQSFGGTLGGITGRLIWLLIPLVIIGLVLWAVR